MRRSTQVIDQERYEDAFSTACTWAVLVLGLALYGLCVALRRASVVLLLVAVHGADWAARAVSSLATAAGERVLADIAAAARSAAMGGPTRPVGAPRTYVIVIVATAPVWAAQPTGVWS